VLLGYGRMSGIKQKPSIQGVSNAVGHASRHTRLWPYMFLSAPMSLSMADSCA